MVRKLGILKQISTKDPICLDLSSTFPSPPSRPYLDFRRIPEVGEEGRV